MSGNNGFDPNARFSEVLAAAIADISTRGYVDETQLNLWLGRLRNAAERELGADWAIDEDVRRGMTSLFDRFVDGIKLPQRIEGGVGRFTKAQIKPRLYAELDRRILADADLIKLHKREAVERTLRRFSGFATSIQIGGDPTVDRQEVRQAIGMDVRNYKFVKRRCDTDQGHKLISNVAELVALDVGAIAGKWNDHGEADTHYNARKEHMERSGKIYLIRGSWADKEGLLIPVNGYSDQITKPGQEVSCFPGDTAIPFADGVEVAYRRWFSGELTKITTLSGAIIRATPNHPVLTPSGWTAIGALNEGNYVVEVVQQQVKFSVGIKNQNDTVPTISEIFGTLVEFGVSKVLGGSDEQFHGDGSDSNIDVVHAARPLAFGIKTSNFQRITEFMLAKTLYSASRPGRFYQSVVRSWFSANGVMRSFCKTLTTFNTLLFHPQLVGFGTTSYGDPRFDKTTFNGPAADTVELRNGKSAVPKEISLGKGVVVDGYSTQSVRIVKVEHESFTGHVYNLQTKAGWYIAQNLIAHNCRCWYTYMTSPRSLPPHMISAKGREWLARGRAELQRRMMG